LKEVLPRAPFQELSNDAVFRVFSLKVFGILKDFFQKVLKRVPRAEPLAFPCDKRGWGPADGGNRSSNGERKHTIKFP
jgi:hypothetical protein